MQQPGRWGVCTGVAFSLLMAATPAITQERAPEIAPGGTIVLRGSTLTNTASQLPPPGPSNPLSTGPAPRAPAPAHGLDVTGFDRRFDRSGLIPQ